MISTTGNSDSYHVDFEALDDYLDTYIDLRSIDQHLDDETAIFDFGIKPSCGADLIIVD